MGTLSDLPGIAAREVEAPLVRSIKGFKDALKLHRAAVSAGDRGSCSVWKDDDGKYRCDFSRFMCTKNAVMFSSWSQVEKWLREWMPKQHRQN